MKVVISSLATLVALSKASPKCDPSDYSRFRWYTCKYNPEKWYGISKIQANFQLATSICADASKDPTNKPGKMFEAFEAQDDLCLFNAMKLDSHGSEHTALIGGKAAGQGIWNVTTEDEDPLHNPKANFWQWCPNDINFDNEDCNGGHEMKYHNENTIADGKSSGTDFMYHINYDELSKTGNRMLQAKIYHNAQQYDKDYGWSMIVQEDANKDYYFTCTIDCNA